MKFYPLKYVFLCQLLIFSACALKPYSVTPEFASGHRNPPVTIFVSDHGWHTGLIVPAREVNQRLPALEHRFGLVPYYEFGWGDAGFYQAKQVTTGLIWKAVIWPTDSVMHVVAVTRDPGAYFPDTEIVELTITREGLDGLIQYIVSSFAKDAEGSIRPVARGIYGDSEFYQAEGKYFLTNTCNTWTAKGLKSSGMDIHATCKLTAGSIMRYLRKADAAHTTRDGMTTIVQ
jgi:uncharacterized protein (TIGR02117 family)